MNKKLTYKDFSFKELKYIFQDYKFKLTPRWHQFVTFAFGLNKDRIMFWHDIGTGKTITSLYMMQIWGVNKIFVTCPNSCIRSWKKEVENYTNYKFVALTGNTWERKNILTEQINYKRVVCCINYEGLKYLFGEKKQRVQYDGTEPQTINKFEIDYPWIEELQKLRFTGFIGDEAHKYQNEKAIQTEIGLAISRKANKVILMTGSPMPNGELSLWSEYYVLDLGQTLGNSFWKYKLRFFKQNQWHQWFLKDKKLSKQILKIISPRTLRFNKSECFDLPKVIREHRDGYLLPKQRKIYNQVANNKLDKDNKDINLSDIIGNNNKLRQIVGGFYFGPDGKVADTFKTIKLQLLDELLDEINGKVMIFHHYVPEGRMIEEFLRKKKIKFSSMRGEIKDKDTQFEQFIKDKSVRAMVLNAQSGGEGLDGFQTVCSTQIFYSNSGKGPAIKEQCEGRIVRSGQNEPCTIIELVIKDTVDEDLIKAGYDERKLARKKLKWMQERGGTINAS